ncbi:MAG: sigma-70 family RNA polymerase sigma factor [Clostridia bacterium]
MQIDYLVEKYSKLVYKICYDMLSNSLDAEDITQEVYISLFTNLDRYSNLKENEIKNIICKIALNKCKDVLKSKIRKLDNITTGEIISLETYKDSRDTYEEIFKIETKEYVENIISNLKEPYKTVLYQYYIKQLTLDEISKKNNVEKATLKMQLYRAKKAFKENVIKSGGESLL